MYTSEQKKAHIRELQNCLHLISCYDSHIPGIIPNGIYDSRTETAVKAFQRQYHLTENGEVNQATWDKIMQIYQKLKKAEAKPLYAFPQKPGAVMHPGEQCFTVMIIQAILKELSEQYHNFPCIQVTGNYDSDTMQAIQLFQKMCDLPVTGDVNCETWNMLAQIGSDMRT